MFNRFQSNNRKYASLLRLHTKHGMRMVLAFGHNLYPIPTRTVSVCCSKCSKSANQIMPSTRDDVVDTVADSMVAPWSIRVAEKWANRLASSVICILLISPSLYDCPRCCELMTHVLGGGRWLRILCTSSARDPVQCA